MCIIPLSERIRTCLDLNPVFKSRRIRFWHLDTLGLASTTWEISTPGQLENDKRFRLRKQICKLHIHKWMYLQACNLWTRTLNIILCFFLKILWSFWTLPVLLQRWFSTCLVCVHTLTPRENRERQSPEYFKIFEKNTIFNEHPVHFIN